MKIKEFKSIICMLDQSKYELLRQGIKFTLMHKEKNGDYSMVGVGEWQDMSFMSLLLLYEMYKVAKANSKISTEDFMKSVAENFYRFVEMKEKDN